MSKLRMRCTGAMMVWAVLAAMSVAHAADATLVTFANGEAITEKDLSGYLDKRIDLRPKARTSAGMETVLREMALTRVLVLEGTAMAEPRRADKGDERFDDIYAQTIFAKKTPNCEAPADAAAARKFFDDNPQAFRVPVTERLSRIMLPDTQMVDGLPAMAWLHMAAKSVATGSKTFDEAAKYAENIYKLEPQGDLGWVALTEQTGVMRALAAALQGEMVGPVREGDFAYLFLIVSKRDARQMNWDEVAVSVPTRALAYCRETTASHIRDRLFKKYGVELNQAAVKALFTKPADK